MRLINYVFVFFVLFYNISFSQTQQETEDWIEEKIEEYSNIEIGMFKMSADVSFVNDTMVVHTIANFTSGKPYHDTHYYVPLTKVNKIRFKDMETNIWLQLLIIDGEKASERHRDGDVVYQDEFYINLDNKLDEENLRKRFEEAFIHLVELNGGEIKKEPF